MKSIRYLKHLLSLVSFFAGLQAAEKIAILVPSTGSWHLEKHDENHEYFKKMHEGFDKIGIRLELFKDWHNPPVLKDYVHYRLDEACSSGIEKDQTNIDRVRKAKILLHAAVPDQVCGGVEAGWRADHRILAAQALAFKIIEYQKAGSQVYLIGLGLGGGQIVAGASRMLSSKDQLIATKSIAGAIGEFANALDGIAPFFGPYGVFVKWGASALAFSARASEILKNDHYLWLSAMLPVELYRRASFAKTPAPKYLINKLFTIATPVGQEHFTPDINCVEFYYNLYAAIDLKCKFLGQKIGIGPVNKNSAANLCINFAHGTHINGHIRMLNSKSLAEWLPTIHERIQNPSEFKFGVPGTLTIFKELPPKYRENSK